MTTATLKYTRAHQVESLGAMAIKSAKYLSFWYDRAMQRRQLAQLSFAQLCDIGISREQALIEAGKPFWRE